jgi:hypothetical protein
MSAQLTHRRTEDWTPEPATPAGGGRLRRACHRLHLALRDMNYGARRAIELQAPWIVDEQWHRR